MGADSHSTSYGAVGAFGSGMGSTDVALIWATGRTWLRVPETIRVQVEGRFRPGVDAKDLALKICQMLTIAGANYMAVEYHGLDWLPLGGRQTLASMAVEMGAKVGIVPPTGVVAERYPVPDWLYRGSRRRSTPAPSTIDLDQLEPQVAMPHAVDQVVDLSEVAGTQWMWSSWAPAPMGAMKICDRRGQHPARASRSTPDVRLIVTPASSRELDRAAADGTLTDLLEAGATLTTPGCGACMGRHRARWATTMSASRPATAISRAAWARPPRRFTWPRRRGRCHRPDAA